MDNDGNALVVGALYYDTTTAKMRVYTASGWIDASSASVATLATFTYNATAGQTTFSGNDSNGVALTYTVGAVIVTLNGVILEAPGDYAASTGSSVVLTSGAAAGDDLNIYAFGNFLVADTYSQAAADARFLNVAGDEMTGVLAMSSGSALLMKASDGATGSNMFHYGVDNHTYIDNFKGGDQVFRGGAGFTERVRITNGGIKYPATQSASSNANTLDDYEEGTFTPIVTSGGGSITSYMSNGYYTKVGNVVTITCAFFINNAGTASGSAAVTLPFTSATVSLYGGNRTCCFFVREDSATGINFQGILGSNSATAALFALNSTAGISWTNGYSYNLCFSYLASN